jgi:hypothetical protein
MALVIIFFVFLIVTLGVVVHVMAPIAEGWRERELAARAECEAIRKRLRARGIEPEA